jgi:hypothetical protein
VTADVANPVQNECGDISVHFNHINQSTLHDLTADFWVEKNCDRKSWRQVLQMLGGHSTWDAAEPRN